MKILHLKNGKFSRPILARLTKRMLESYEFEDIKINSLDVDMSKKGLVVHANVDIDYNLKNLLKR